jgi:hypothetical protein
MLHAVKGYFDNGRVILTEEAPVHSKTEVIVTFLTSDKDVKKEKRVPGSLKGLVTTPDDFNDPLDDLKDYM